MRRDRTDVAISATYATCHHLGTFGMRLVAGHRGIALARRPWEAGSACGLTRAICGGWADIGTIHGDAGTKRPVR